MLVLELVLAMLLMLVRTAQAKNGDNTKAAAVPARGRHGGEGGKGRRRVDTTLDISYPSARNPLTS